MFMLCVAPASCSSMFCSALDQTAGVSVQHKCAMESGRMARDTLPKMGQQYSMKKMFRRLCSLFEIWIYLFIIP